MDPVWWLSISQLLCLHISVKQLDHWTKNSQNLFRKCSICWGGGEKKRKKKSWKTIKSEHGSILCSSNCLGYHHGFYFFESFLLCLLDIKVMLFVDVCSNLKINRTHWFFCLVCIYRKEGGFFPTHRVIKSRKGKVGFLFNKDMYQI